VARLRRDDLGGLLAAVDPERAAEIPGTVVGRLTEGDAGTIAVR
jgi:hypothetical protein